MSAKAVAKCFWHREVEEELLEQGLREKWVFTDLTEVANIMGTYYDDVMEFVDRNRCEDLYTHNCSDHCKEKGIVAKVVGCAALSIY